MMDKDVVFAVDVLAASPALDRNWSLSIIP